MHHLSFCCACNESKRFDSSCKLKWVWWDLSYQSGDWRSQGLAGARRICYSRRANEHR
jgi:hypothetical protein